LHDICIANGDAYREPGALLDSVTDPQCHSIYESVWFTNRFILGISQSTRHVIPISYWLDPSHGDTIAYWVSYFVRNPFDDPNSDDIYERELDAYTHAIYKWQPVKICLSTADRLPERYNEPVAFCDPVNHAKLIPVCKPVREPVGIDHSVIHRVG
jgi:hypothetical protein